MVEVYGCPSWADDYCRVSCGACIPCSPPPSTRQVRRRVCRRRQGHQTHPAHRRHRHRASRLQPYRATPSLFACTLDTATLALVASGKPTATNYAAAAQYAAATVCTVLWSD